MSLQPISLAGRDSIMSPKGGGGGEVDDEVDLSEGVVVPDAPTALEISEYDATSANLKWKGSSML